MVSSVLSGDSTLDRSSDVSSPSKWSNFNTLLHFGGGRVAGCVDVAETTSVIAPDPMVEFNISCSGQVMLSPSNASATVGPALAFSVITFSPFAWTIRPSSCKARGGAEFTFSQWAFTMGPILSILGSITTMSFDYSRS